MLFFLADSDSYAWEFATKIKENLKYVKPDKGSSYSILEIFKKNSLEKIPLFNLKVNLFNNKELGMKVEKNIRKKDVYFIHDSSKDPQYWWTECLLVKDLLLSSSAKSVTFVLPDMFYSRQDRKTESRVPISARAFANSVSPGLERIVTMDLHSDQIQGFYPANVPLDNLYSFPAVAKYLCKNYPKEANNLVVVSPDAGGGARAKSFLKRMGRYNLTPSFAVIDKTRSKPGEIEKMDLVGSVSNKNVLIIDDIIDTGGTLCKASDLLREKGADKVFCYATHGIFSKGSGELKKHFDSVFVGNTHPVKEKDLEVIDITPTFAEAIYRIQNGLSISQLFK